MTPTKTQMREGRSLKAIAFIEIAPSPHELAMCFWAMDAGEQAVFFNCLAEAASTSGWDLCLQMCEVNDIGYLTAEGRFAMRVIGRYGEHSYTPEDQQ